MPTNLITPWTATALGITVLLLALILIPLLAITAANFFDAVRRILLRFASSLGILIKRVWGRDDVVAKKRAEIEEAYQDEVRKRSQASLKLLTKEEVDQIRAIVTQQFGGEQDSSGITGNVRKLWGGKSKQQKQIDEEVRKEIRRQSSVPQTNLTPEELRQIRDMVEQQHGGVPEPSIGLLTSAWVRRIIYLLLAIVCVGSDYVLVSTRAPILFGGGETPPFLRVLFGYLQVITGVLFVSIAALSGMLIQEHSKGLPDVVKIEPDIAPTEKKLKLGLAIAMFVIDVIVVIFLTLGGIFQQYLQQQDLEVIYVVFIGTSVLVAVGIFLAWTGLYQAIEGLGALVLGGSVALICMILAAICSFLVAFLSLLDGINGWLWSLFTGKERKPRPVVVEKRDLAIVGFGTQGGNFAFGICQEIGRLFGAYAWLTGIYMPNGAQGSRMEKQLIQSKVAAHSVSVPATTDSTRAAADLVKNLERYYNTKSDAVKPLLWVTAGNELTTSLPYLQDLGKKGNIQNIRLVIVWIVPEIEEIDDAIRATAVKLQAWAQDPRSILATTLVIQANSRLTATMGDSQFAVLYRSVAALLTEGEINPDASFATVAMQLKNGRYCFSALAAGAIGVDASPSDFTNGLISGGKGEINPIIASETVKFLAEMAFAKQTLSTVADTLTAVPFVNLIVPTRLRLVKEFQTAVSKWLRRDYGMNQEKVTVIPLTNERDKGIDISGQIRQLKGDFYFHLTAFRGVGTGHGEIPQDLRGGAATDSNSTPVSGSVSSNGSTPAASGTGFTGPMDSTIQQV